MPSLFFSSIFFVFVYVTLWFFYSLVKKRNDIADIAWGLGYIGLCVFYFFTGDASLREMLMYGLILIWGIRLSLHIYFRNRGKEEDFRYLQWRNDWGKWFYLRSYFQIYLLQGFLLLLIMTPVMITSVYPQQEVTWLDFIGMVVWSIGFFFEAVGDWQLSRFIKNPKNKGKVMMEGLWKYTRHPNYFGEVTLWWGIGLMALNSPFGFYGLLGPIVITVLILFVSGIPMLEKKYADRQNYQEYKKKTSVFFPFPPKK